MASFHFRPPQFSDDAAWLPAWIQSDQAATPLDHRSQDSLHHSLQDMDLLNSDKNQVKDPNLLPSTESLYKIGQLYLSGEGNTPLTLTPSCEKALHFNLHLSTDGISSNFSPSTKAISQDDKLNSAKSNPVQRAKALYGSQGTCQSNMDHNLSAINFLPEKSSGNVHTDHNQAQSNGTSARQDILDIFDSKGTECNDISDAVELSVAASEALAIYEVVKSGSVSEALPAAAILEVALQVKQARLDGMTGPLCYSKADGNTADSLSDLTDSDMEDAFKDVGLSAKNIDSILLRESSISRVKDTLMSEFRPPEEAEVQSEEQRDQQICFSNSFATKPLEKILDASTSKDLLTEIMDSAKQEMIGRIPRLDSILGSACESQNKNLDDLQITQEEGIACRMKSNDTKMIRGLFVAETSYLSESADAAPDQNSFVHNHCHCSKASESSICLETSHGKTGVEGLVDQDIVKDLCIDPLCSIVPCSISEELNNPPHATSENDDTGMLGAMSNQKTDSYIPNISLRNGQTRSGDNGDIVGRKKVKKVLLKNLPSTFRSRQFGSLRPYSVGLMKNSMSSLKRAFNCGLANPGDYGATFPLGKQEASSTKCRDENELMKLPPVISISDCATVRSDDTNHETRLPSKGQLISFANTSHEKVHRRRSAFGSSSCHTAKSNEENLGTSGFGNASPRPIIQENFGQNAKNGGELLVQPQEIQISPLVLSRRTHHRFKAPKPPVPELSTANQVENQSHGSDMVYHKCTTIPQDPDKKLPDSDIPARKKVRFSEVDMKFHPRKNHQKIMPRSKIRSSCRVRDRPDSFEQELGTASQEVKERLTNCHVRGRKKTVFQGLEFLLTGFSKKKEKEIETLLRKHGGMVLSDIPSPPPHRRGRRSLEINYQKLPVILCPKKLQTTKFLYGCAVNAFLLKVAWAYDSIKAGSVLSPDKYVISFNQTGRNLNQIGQSVCENNDSYIFDKVGFMLHGRNSFCSKLVKVIKHGRGHVYRSLHWLVQSLENKNITLGAVVTGDENRATRHLKKCAAEQKIPVVPATWIMRSLFEGRVLPFDNQNHYHSHSPATDVPSVSAQPDWSQEI